MHLAPHFFKVVFAAEELTVNYKIMPVDLLKGATKSPEHLQRHPFGKIPVIEHDGQFIFESNAIIRHMGSLSENALYPSEPFSRARVETWLEYFAHQAGRWCTSIWFQKCIGPKFLNQATDEALVQELTERLMTDMPIINAQLERNEFIAGPSFTLADVVAHTLMNGAREASVPLDQYENFQRWFKSIDQRPALARTTAAVEAIEI